MAKTSENHMFVMMCDTPWDWTADYVRKTTEQLSRHGKVFCFFWIDLMSLKEYFLSRKKLSLVKWVTADVMLYQAVYFVPFIRFKLVVKLNRLINLVIFKGLIFGKLGFKKYKKVLWVFHPHFGEIVKYFSDYKIVYDSLDYFIGGAEGKQREEFLAAEKLLLKKADLVTANSHFLQGRLLTDRRDTILVPQGFEVSAFKSMSDDKSGHKEFKRPVVGYVGGINFRLDYDLLYLLAVKHPNWQLVLWGPQQDMELHPETADKWEKLLGLKNVIWGVSERNKLGSIIRQFDVAIIPYRMDQAFNKYCYPMKVFEYLYLGRSIVSADIDEFGYPPFKDGLVQIAKTLQEWEDCIGRALKTSITKSQVEVQQKFALENSWENKLSRILDRLLVLEN